MKNYPLLASTNNRTKFIYELKGAPTVATPETTQPKEDSRRKTLISLEMNRASTRAEQTPKTFERKPGEPLIDLFKRAGFKNITTQNYKLYYNLVKIAVENKETGIKAQYKEKYPHAFPKLDSAEGKTHLPHFSDNCREIFEELILEKEKRINLGKKVESTITAKTNPASTVAPPKTTTEKTPVTNPEVVAINGTLTQTLISMNLPNVAQNYKVYAKELIKIAEARKTAGKEIKNFPKDPLNPNKEDALPKLTPTEFQQILSIIPESESFPKLATQRKIPETVKTNSPEKTESGKIIIRKKKYGSTNGISNYTNSVAEELVIDGIIHPIKIHGSEKRDAQDFLFFALENYPSAVFRLQDNTIHTPWNTNLKTDSITSESLNNKEEIKNTLTANIVKEYALDQEGNRFINLSWAGRNVCITKLTTGSVKVKSGYHGSINANEIITTNTDSFGDKGEFYSKALPHILNQGFGNERDIPQGIANGSDQVNASGRLNTKIANLIYDFLTKN